MTNIRCIFVDRISMIYSVLRIPKGTSMKTLADTRKLTNGNSLVFLSTLKSFISHRSSKTSYDKLVTVCNPNDLAMFMDCHIKIRT